MKYDTVDGLVVFSLMFDDSFIHGTTYDQSPDYILEKFHQCFVIEPNSLRLITNHSIELVEYKLKWGVEDDNSIIYNIMSFLIENSKRDNFHKIGKVANILSNFRTYICDYKSITTTDKFWVLHHNAQEIVDKLLMTIQDNTNYINPKRMMVLDSLINEL